MSINTLKQASHSQLDEKLLDFTHDEFNELISHIFIPQNSEPRESSDIFLSSLFNPDLHANQIDSSREQLTTYTPLPTSTVPFPADSSTTQKVSRITPQNLSLNDGEVYDSERQGPSSLPIAPSISPKKPSEEVLAQFLVCDEKIDVDHDEGSHLKIDRHNLKRSSVQPSPTPVQPLPFDIVKENPYWIIDDPLTIAPPLSFVCRA